MATPIVFTDVSNQTESSLDLSQIAQLQGTRTRSLNNPITVSDKAMLTQRHIQLNVDHWSISIDIRWERFMTKIRTPKQSDEEWKQILSHTRHDHVASMNLSKTDTSLRVLGIQRDLTPDFIDPSSKVVIELATCAVDYDKILDRAYKKKILAYEAELHGKGITYCILVVSPFKVMTNCFLRDDIISELCRRCREGLSMESTIEEKSSIRVNTGDYEDDTDLAKVDEIIDKISNLSLYSAWDFNEDLRLQSLQETRKDDEIRSKELLDRSWQKSMNLQSKLSADSLDNYHKSLLSQETRDDQKRIFVLPAFLPDYTNESAKFENFIGMGNFQHEEEYVDIMSRLWTEGIASSFSESRQHPESVHYLTSLSEAYTGELEKEKHHLRRAFTFTDTLGEEEKIQVASSGPGAKAFSMKPEIVEHEKHQKKGFSPFTSTTDVKEFIEGDGMTGFNSKISSKSTIFDMINKSEFKTGRRQISKKMFNWLGEMDIINYSNFVSSLCLELSYEYKIPHKPGAWTCKAMRDYPVLILLKATGSHIFFSLCVKSSSALIWDTGRLGAKCWSVGEYIISDFSSMVEGTLEHFLKAGPYMASISAYLMQHFSVQFLTQQVTLSLDYFQTLKGIFLIYMNNKTDVENLIMDTRFLFMTVLQRHESDPYKFISRLPEVLRSRLSVYYLGRVEWVMNFYRSRKPRQVKVHGIPESDPNSVRYLGLRSVFHNSPVSLDQLIDSFYFSYPVSKMKGRVGDRSFKIVKKIVVEEMWAREHIKEVRGIIWSERKEPERHAWSPALLRFLIDNCKLKWAAIHGGNWCDQLMRHVKRDFAKRKFSELATLKASSKDHLNPQINLPKFELEASTGKEYVEKLKKLNPKLSGKRPRVISALVKLIYSYMNDTGDQEPTLLKILAYSCKELHERGYIYSDCFPKDQHGGDREIHVLEIKARILQFFVERVAICMSNLFRSDSVLNPKRKDGFMREHELMSQAKLGNHLTICKSADATKWCQRHHVSKFYFAMNRITGGKIDSLLYLTFSLWVRKRIAIPNELVGILHTSHFDESTNKTLKWLKQSFLSGSPPFVGEDSNTIEIKFGMWQGIWHRVSSIFHSIVQEAYADIVRAVCTKRKMSVVVTVIQGSDDSACAISYSSRRKFDHLYLHMILKWKEEIQKYLSIWPSEAKTSIGTLLLVEYNSEWWYRGKVIKPTFRWVSACMETTIVETFYERQQIFYNELSTAVENGVCTLTASVIQKCQAWLHYIIMGFGNHVLRTTVAEQLIAYPHPALGFFPLDGEEYCGTTGFDYSLYSLKCDTGLEIQSDESEVIHPSTVLDYDEKIDKSLRKDLRNIVLRFGNKKIWQRIVDEMEIGELQDALNVIKEDPSRLYEERSHWEDQRMWMIMKLFETGVRASLAAWQPTIRSAVSSSYLFNRQCLSSRLSSSEVEKVSLLRAIVHARTKEVMMKGEKKNDDIKQLNLFPNQIEYCSFYDYIQELRKGFSFQEVPYGRHSKVTIPVWGEMNLSEVPLIDIVKRQWFDHPSVHVSRSVFKLLWQECKSKYRFLRDKYDETIRDSGLDHVELHSFLQSASKKTRKITLQDTSVKNPDLISALTRIYWPQIKIRTSSMTIDQSILTLRHMLMCATNFFFSKKHKQRVVKQILRKSNIVDMTLKDCPMRSRRIKVISDWLMNQDKAAIIRDIPYAKNGVMGFFIKRQDRKWDSKGRISYTGEGVWVGSVCDVPCRLEIKGRTLVRIQIKYLQDSVSLSKRLKLLCTELSLTPPEFPIASKSYYYLNSKGHFIVSPIPVQDCFAVETNKDQDFPELESLIKKDWHVEISGSTIRLCYEEDIMQQDIKYVTIISDTFTSRDWSPQLTPRDLSWTKSNLFPSYCRGEGIMPHVLLEELAIQPNREYMSNLLSRMSEQDHELGIYSLKALGQSLMNYIMLSKSHRDQQDAYLEMMAKKKIEGEVVYDIDEKDFADMIGFEEPMTELFSTVESWAEAVEKEEGDSESRKLRKLDGSSDELEITETDLEEEEWTMDNRLVEEISDLFFTTDLEDYNVSYMEFDLLKSMPLENLFWNEIVLMSRSESCGEKVLMCMTENRKPSSRDGFLSHVAFYFSLACMQNLYKPETRDSPSESDIGLVTSTKDPILTGEDAEKHLEELERTISQIDDVLEGLPEGPREILRKKRKELVLQREAYQNMSEDTIYPEIQYWDFMDSLIRQLKEHEIWDKSALTSDLEALVTLLLSQCLEESVSMNRMRMIADSDLNQMRVRIWDRMVSTNLMRYITLAFSLSAGFKYKGKMLYECDAKIISKSIDFVFN